MSRIYFFKNIFIYLFVYLFSCDTRNLRCRVRDLCCSVWDLLVAACGLLVVACMRGLVPQLGMEPRPPALAVRSQPLDHQGSS